MELEKDDGGHIIMEAIIGGKEVTRSEYDAMAINSCDEAQYP